MKAKLLDGKKLSLKIRQQISDKIKTKVDNGAAPPGLAVILVGNDSASEIYVNNKRKACEAAGIKSEFYHLAKNVSEIELIELIDTLNINETINGILVQLPLPEHINKTSVIERIRPDKDVDGFHPYNIGRLAQRIPLLRPCTPKGIINLLEYYEVPIKSKHAVVVGASNIVGRPLSMELLIAGATVTTCHRFTHSLQPYVETADILIVATGKRGLINPNWLKEHQVVVDVGIHRLENGKLCGDVDFDNAVEKVSWITPVPGGIGPMTIATLLDNTYSAYLNQQK